MPGTWTDLLHVDEVNVLRGKERSTGTVVKRKSAKTFQPNVQITQMKSGTTATLPGVAMPGRFESQ